MFSKISRYQRLPDITTVDRTGRMLISKPLRLLPETEGKFLHTVEEVDRLDHLGYKYYKQSRKWWRICDANPDFMSPQALLGKEPVVITHFPLVFEDTSSQAPWADLIKGLSQVIGIENFKILDEIKIVQEKQMISDKEITVNTERFEMGVVVTYNRMNVNAKDILDLITNTGFSVGELQDLGRIGKSIIIPPDMIG